MHPLEGLLVISIEQVVAARVIKIERDDDDFARNYDTTAKGESSYLESTEISGVT